MSKELPMVSLSWREFRRELPPLEIEISWSSSWRLISLSLKISLLVSKLRPRSAFWPVKYMSMPLSSVLRSKTSLSMSSTWVCWRLTTMNNSARWSPTHRRCTLSLVCTWCTYLLTIKSLNITQKSSLSPSKSSKIMSSLEFLSLLINSSWRALTTRFSLKSKMSPMRPISFSWITSWMPSDLK